jgi:hypothetical protein
MNINGHSGATVRNHYQYQDRIKDVANAMVVMSAISTNPTALASPPPLLNAAATTNFLRSHGGQSKRSKPVVHLDIDELLQAAKASDDLLSTEEVEEATEAFDSSLPWGTSHPFYGSERKRIPWTEVELKFIGRWCDAALAADPAITQVAAKCRSAIIEDYPEMISHFHLHHILSPQRITHGRRMFLLHKLNDTL